MRSIRLVHFFVVVFKITQFIVIRMKVIGFVQEAKYKSLMVVKQPEQNELNVSQVTSTNQLGMRSILIFFSAKLFGRF